MIGKRGLGNRAFEIVNYTVLTLLMIITLYPMWHVLMASFSQPVEVMKHSGPILLPLGIDFSSYAMVFRNPNILSSFKNSVIIVVFGTIINMVMTLLAGYAFSRKHVYITKKIMPFVIFTMYFSGGMIPTFLLVNNWLHLGDSYLALWLPIAISTYNMIIMRTGFAAIPDSMGESAKIDGANEFVILIRIAIPLALPTIAVIVLYYAVGHWNSWFSAMMYLKSRDKFPLSLILREILISNSTESMTSASGASGDTVPIAETIKYATTIIAIVPILVIYPFLQKYFVKGMMIGAVKG